MLDAVARLFIACRLVVYSRRKLIVLNLILPYFFLLPLAHFKPSVDGAMWQWSSLLYPCRYVYNKNRDLTRIDLYM